MEQLPIEYRNGGLAGVGKGNGGFRVVTNEVG